MKSFFLFIILLPWFLVSCYSPSTEESMENLSKIKGEWVSYKGVKFSENWRLTDDNQLEGKGFSLNENDTSFLELLRIYSHSDSIYYSVTFEEEDPVKFWLLESSKTSWTFINPDNEYPSIINYTLEDDTILTAKISNIRGKKEMFFYLKRK